MESIRIQEPMVAQTGNSQKGWQAALAPIVDRVYQLFRKLHRNQRGVTGLETAILLTSFMAASSGLGAVYMQSSLEVNTDVQSVAMETVSSIIEEGQVYIKRQRLMGPRSSSMAEGAADRLASLNTAILEALDGVSPYTVEVQEDGTPILNVELDALGLAGAEDVVGALKESLGSELPYSIEVEPEEGIRLRMELPPSFAAGAADQAN